MSRAPRLWPSYRERLDVEKAKLQFEDLGYICAENFFSEEEIGVVNRELERYIAEVMETVPSQCIFCDDRAKPAETQSPAINGLADELLDLECQPKNVQYFSKPPGAKRTPHHQDGQYFMHDKGLTFWLALDDADEVNGCMYYVPGSYKYGLLPHQKSDTLGFSQALSELPSECKDAEVCMPATAGTMLGHHPYTVHSAGCNRDCVRSRPALGLTYWANECIADAKLQAKHNQYQRLLTEQLHRDGKI